MYLINIFNLLGWLTDISWYFQGRENFKVTAVRNSIVRIICTVAIFAFVRNKSSLVQYTLIFSIAALLGSLTLFPYLRDEVKFTSIKFNYFIKTIKGVMELFLPVIAIQLYTVLNKVMLGAMSSSSQVGFYSQSNQIINVAITLISSFVAVLTPRIAELYSDHNKEKINEYAKLAVSFVFLLGLPMMCGLIMVSKLFVPIFFGPGYTMVIDLLNLQSCLFVILGLGQLLGTFLVAMNRQSKYTIAVSCAAVVNLLVNYLLLKRGLASVGVVYSSILSEIVATIIQAYVLRDVLSFRYYFSRIKIYLVPSLLMIVIIYLVQFFIHTHMCSLILSIIGGTFTYFVYLYLIKDKYVKLILVHLKNRRLDK